MAHTSSIRFGGTVSMGITSKQAGIKQREQGNIPRMLESKKRTIGVSARAQATWEGQRDSVDSPQPPLLRGAGAGLGPSLAFAGSSAIEARCGAASEASNRVLMRVPAALVSRRLTSMRSMTPWRCTGRTPRLARPATLPWVRESLEWSAWPRAETVLHAFQTIVVACQPPRLFCLWL